MEIMTNLQPLCDVLGPQKKNMFFTTQTSHSPRRDKHLLSFGIQSGFTPKDFGTQSINQPIKQAINQSINQSTNQSSNQSINQSINLAFLLLNNLGDVVHPRDHIHRNSNKMVSKNPLDMETLKKLSCSC